MSLTQINKAGLDEIALDHVFTIGASGSSAYTFQGEGLNGTVNNPTLYLTRGKTYRFENGSGGHPIRIQSTSGASGTAYNTGVTNNAGSGTVIVEVQHDAPDVLYYQCTSHPAMNGILYITGALADSGVTTAKIADDAVTAAKIASGVVGATELGTGAVTEVKIASGAVTQNKIGADAVNSGQIADGAVITAAIADDAVIASKIADNAVVRAAINADAVSTSKIENNAVTTAKIADEAVTLAKLPHGTSSNDGKFLRANNGADPTFETVSGTTISGNANNRIITGSDTANTLNAEAEVLFDATTSDFSIIGSQPSRVMDLIVQNTHNGGAAAGARLTLESGSNANTGPQLGFRCGTHTWYLQVPKAAGNLEFNNNDTGLNFLMADDGDFHIVDGDLVFSTNGHGIDFSATGDASGANNELLDDYEEGTWTPNPHGYWSGAWRPATVTGGQIEGATYTKIGRLVYFKCYFSNVTLNSNAQGTYARIDGLPYTSANDSYGSNTTSAHSNAFANTNAGSFYIAPNNSYMLGTRYGSDSYDYATWKSGNFYLMLAGTYQAV